VAAYFVCISVLHVTSSTLLQFQTFNTTMTTSAPTALGWPDDISGLSRANWGTITASLPVVKQLPGLVSAGLSNATIYDTLQVSPAVGNATVNATTITSRCGLIPNMTISEDSTYIGGNLELQGATPPCMCGFRWFSIIFMNDVHRGRPNSIHWGLFYVR
jgi:hypothetical protein